MADVQLSDQDTLTEAELDSAIIAVQAGTSKVWRKVTPAELLTLLGVSTEPDVKGQLIATMPMPAGTYSRAAPPDYITNFFPNWSIESGITGFSIIDVPVSTAYGVPVAITDAVLVTPDLRVNNAQFGWFFELTNGDTIVGEALTLINDNNIGLSLRSADDADIQITALTVPNALISNLTSIAFFFFTASDFTIAASDDYNISLYTAEI